MNQQPAVGGIHLEGSVRNLTTAALLVSFRKGAWTLQIQIL